MPKNRIEQVGDFDSLEDCRLIVYQNYAYDGFNALTRTALKRVLKAYLPDSIFEQLDLSSLEVSERMDLEMIGHNAVFYLKEIFKGSGELLEIYGSAEELVSNLKKFCTFTNSFEELWEPYRNCVDYELIGERDVSSMSPAPRLSASGRKLLTKQETFVYLRNRFIHRFQRLTDELPCLMLTLYLKYKQREIESTLEFVDIEGKDFSSIVDEVEKAREKYNRKDRASRSKKLIGSNKESTIKAFKDLLVQYTVDDAQTREALERYFQAEPPTEGSVRYAYIRDLVDFTFKSLEQLMGNLGSIFLSKPVIDTIVEGESAVAFFRIFKDGEKRFVLEKEQASHERKPETPGYWRTLPMGETEILENIPTRIIRTEHRAVPVYGPDGKLCKLAIDVFFEMLDDLIFGLRVFDSEVENSKQRVMDFLNGLPDVMDMTEKNMYFICEEKYVEINRKVQEAFADFKGTEKRIYFSNVEANPIDLLKSLCIADDFHDEELSRIAAIAFRKNEKKSPADVCGMLSTAVKIMLVSRIPLLNTFVHNQNGCRRVLRTKRCSTHGAKKCFDSWNRILKGRSDSSASDLSDVDASAADERITDSEKKVIEKLPLVVKSYYESVKERTERFKEAIELRGKEKSDRNGLLKQCTEWIEESKARKDRSVASREEDFKRLKDENEKLREDVKKLNARMNIQLHMSPGKHRIYLAIQKRIEQVESGELGKAANGIFDKMETKYKNALEEHVKDLKKIAASIRENPWQDISKDVLGSFPEFTVEFVAPLLENGDVAENGEDGDDA